MKTTKFKGGALLFALSILLFSCVLITLFLSFVQGSSKINDKHLNYYAGINKMEEGIRLGSYLNTSTYVGTKADKTDNLEVMKKPWGLYTVVAAKVELDSRNTISKVGLIGQRINQDYCLYLANSNSKLSLTGNTLIEGNCFLPKSGVDISFVEGKSFERKKMVEGKIVNSKTELPLIDLLYIKNNRTLLKGIFNPKTDSLVSLDQIISKKIAHSFFKKTLVISGNSSLFLGNSWELSGNIVIHSSSKITIGKGAKLSNIIVCANDIMMEKGVDISAQLIGANTLILDSNSTLSYPSSVLTIGKNSNIQLKGNASLNGTLVSYSKEANSMNSVSIGKNSVVTGLIYCTNETELKGTVRGKIITQKFFHQSPSTTYTNTLIDAKITNKNLPDIYSCSSFLKENIKQTSVLTWLK